MTVDNCSCAADALDRDVGAQDPVFEAVCTQIRALLPAGTQRRDMNAQTLLIDELGLDSLKFVDLTVGIEDALGLDEFPMQEWVDEEFEAERPLSCGALVEACRRCLAARSEPR